MRIRTWWHRLLGLKVHALQCPWQHHLRPRQKPSRPEVLWLEARYVPSVVLGTQFAGLTFADSQFVPPDAQIAAGPSHVVEVVNSQVAIYLKTTGTRVFLQPLSTFFNAQTSAALAPPLVIYDDLANRFVIGALQA